MRAVVDASMAFAWISNELLSEHSARLLDEVVTDGALAPPLFRLEIANALLNSERRRKIDRPTRLAMSSDMMALPVAMDDEPIRNTWRRSLDLAKAFGLTVYDATYLELAERVGLPLATLDAALIRSAPLCGVTLA